MRVRLRSEGSLHRSASQGRRKEFSPCVSFQVRQSPIQRKAKPSVMLIPSPLACDNRLVTGQANVAPETRTRAARVSFFRWARFSSSRWASQNHDLNKTVIPRYGDFVPCHPEKPRLFVNSSCVGTGLCPVRPEPERSVILRGCDFFDWRQYLRPISS